MLFIMNSLACTLRGERRHILYIFAFIKHKSILIILIIVNTENYNDISKILLPG